MTVKRVTENLVIIIMLHLLPGGAPPAPPAAAGPPAVAAAAGLPANLTTGLAGHDQEKVSKCLDLTEL